MLPCKAVTPASGTAITRYFHEEVRPAPTPLATASSRPFPMLASLSLNLALLLAPAEGEEHTRLAVVQVPARLPRLVRLPGGDGTTSLLLEEILRGELPALFPGQQVRESAGFRTARDSEP